MPNDGSSADFSQNDSMLNSDHSADGFDPNDSMLIDGSSADVSQNDSMLNSYHSADDFDPNESMLHNTLAEEDFNDSDVGDQVFHWISPLSSTFVQLVVCFRFRIPYRALACFSDFYIEL
jgi:hypothetical protein